MTKKWEDGAVLLRWAVNSTGYEIRPPTAAEAEAFRLKDAQREKLFVLPKPDGEQKHYQVTLGDSDIFTDLINASADDSGLLQFADKWGTLRKAHGSYRVSFLSVQKRLKRVFENGAPTRDKFMQQFSLGDWQGFGTVGTATLRFEPHEPSGKSRLYWSVRDLGDYLNLELLTSVGGNARIVHCESCGKFFARGIAKGPAPEHCSNACKQKAYRKRQALLSVG